MSSASVMRRLLSPNRVMIADHAKDKWDAIRQLVDKCVESGDLPLHQRDQALKAVYEREQRSSTGLGNGFAVPHGVHDETPSEFGAVGVFRGGVDFHGTYAEPSRVVLMLLYPWEGRQDHIENLANAVRFLSAGDLTSQIPSLERPQEVYCRLSRENCGGDDEY